MRRITRNQLTQEAREGKLKESCLIVNTSDYPLAIALTLDEYDSFRNCCEEFSKSSGEIHGTTIRTLSYWIQALDNGKPAIKSVLIKVQGSPRFDLISTKWLPKLEELIKNVPTNT